MAFSHYFLHRDFHKVMRNSPSKILPNIFAGGCGGKIFNAGFTSENTGVLHSGVDVPRANRQPMNDEGLPSQLTHQQRYCN